MKIKITKALLDGGFNVGDVLLVTKSGEWYSVDGHNKSTGYSVNSTGRTINDFLKSLEQFYEFEEVNHNTIGDIDKMGVLMEVSNNRVESYISTVKFYVFRVWLDCVDEKEITCNADTVDLAFKKVVNKVKSHLSTQLKDKLKQVKELEKEIEVLDVQISILSE